MSLAFGCADGWAAAPGGGVPRGGGPSDAAARGERQRPVWVVGQAEAGLGRTAMTLFTPVPDFLNAPSGIGCSAPLSASRRHRNATAAEVWRNVTPADITATSRPPGLSAFQACFTCSMSACLANGGFMTTRS